jgi:glucose-6-phosphate-specific signal transduction histidine kinase
LARRSAVPVDLDIPVTGRLPEPVEIAAYYAVAEALTNTARHARASAAEIEVAVGEGSCTCIRDDGRSAGFRGAGLIGLRDRVEPLTRLGVREHGRVSSLGSAGDQRRVRVGYGTSRAAPPRTRSASGAR